MFLIIFVALFVSANGRDLLEPKFQVLTPDELMVEVPHYDDMKLVTFRIGVRRKENEMEDLERGENVINNNRIFIYDERLDLKRGDTVNYLLAFKDKEGYLAQTGKYVFDGVYFKKPFGRRQRFRRELFTTTEKSQYNTDDTEELDGVESRFGHGHGHHHHHGRWPTRHDPPGFNPFGPPQYGPPHYSPPDFSPPTFPNHPHHSPPPNFGRDCNDHRHDMCHQQEPEKWKRTTLKPVGDKDYHCRICHQEGPSKSRETTTTTTEFPEIDIRFSD